MPNPVSRLALVATRRATMRLHRLTMAVDMVADTGVDMVVMADTGVARDIGVEIRDDGTNGPNGMVCTTTNKASDTSTGTVRN